ncbi:MAG: DUF4389 domain-containing protein [Trebonia sp.]
MAFRLILAVPHLIVLYGLGIAASVVVTIGWFAALATGRLPRFAADYLPGYLHWYCRTAAYLLLLTDQYPPFTLDDTACPVRAAAGHGRLRRPAVLFRVILAIPAAIASTLLAYGALTIVILIAWPTALVTGKLPGSLHQALAAVLRYVTRYYCYLYLLTDTYPAGLFGDQPGSPEYGPSGYGTPPVPGYGTPPAAAPGQDASWRLVLLPGASRVVRLILVLGLLAVFGEGFAIATTINAAVTRDREINQLNADTTRHNAAVARYDAAAARQQQAVAKVGYASARVTAANDALDNMLNSPAANSSNCTTVSCFNADAVPVADAFAAFGRTLHATPFPAGSVAIVKRLISDTAGNEQIWEEITRADSFASIENIASEQAGDQFDNDDAALQTELSQEATTLNEEATTLDDQAATLNRDATALDLRAWALNVTVNARAADLL